MASGTPSTSDRAHRDCGIRRLAGRSRPRVRRAPRGNPLHGGVGADRLRRLPGRPCRLGQGPPGPSLGVRAGPARALVRGPLARRAGAGPAGARTIGARRLPRRPGTEGRRRARAAGAARRARQTCKALVRSDRQRAGRRGGHVDQRLHREEGADGHREADRHRDGEHRVARRRSAGWRELQLRGVSEVHRPHDAEVVVGRDHRRDHARDDQPPEAAVVGSGEDVELADEAAGQREAEHAEHEHPHRDAEERALPSEAGEVRERHRLTELAFPRGDHGERADRHRRVRDEVVHQRTRAELGGGGDADQHEAGVRDRRVRQDPLDVPLDERRDVSPRERDAGDRRDRVAPEVRLLRERGRQDAVGDGQGGHLCRRAHERRHRGRRALIGVRRPHVERRGRRLEREPGDDHREPDHERRVVRVTRRRDLRERQLAGGAVDERRAEEKRCRPHRADDEVLETGLQRPDQVDVDRRQHVERDREPLETEEERHQVRRLHEERHAGACRSEQRVVLGHVFVAHLLPVRDEHRSGAAARKDHLRECAPAVAIHALVDEGGGNRAAVVEQHRQRE